MQCLSCEAPHSTLAEGWLKLASDTRESRAISTDQTFTDCVILGKEAFDPDAVFLDDIVDDDVLPYLSLAVDGLTDAADKGRKEMELRPDDVAHDANIASTTMPVAILDPEELEVYGWESSFWRKVVGYLRF